jgi:hypothetical protein
VKTSKLATGEDIFSRSLKITGALSLEELPYGPHENVCKGQKIYLGRSE